MPGDSLHLRSLLLCTTPARCCRPCVPYLPRGSVGGPYRSRERLKGAWSSTAEAVDCGFGRGKSRGPNSFLTSCEVCVGQRHMQGGCLWFPWLPRFLSATLLCTGAGSQQLPKFSSGGQCKSFIHLVCSPFLCGLLQKSGPG